MKYFTVAPPAALKPYVRAFWVLEMDLLPAMPYVYRSMADGCAEMVFHYAGVFDEIVGNEVVSQAHSMIQGPSRKFRRFSTTTGFGIFGVYLYPFALPALFGLPATDFANEMPTLQSLPGTLGAVLEEQVMLAATNEARVALVSHFLLRQLACRAPEHLPVHHAIRTIIHSTEMYRIGDLASDYALSLRQFERQFKKHAGFTPKTFSRIIRFQSALNQYGAADASLTSIAYHCGYYDQAHFISDFKEFSGYNPGIYFAGKSEGIEYREG